MSRVQLLQTEVIFTWANEIVNEDLHEDEYVLAVSGLANFKLFAASGRYYKCLLTWASFSFTSLAYKVHCPHVTCE